MGINSTEVSYGFGQMGSGFQNTAVVTTPPAGMVIISMTFLADTTFSALVADTSGIDATAVAGNVGYFSHTAAVPVVQGVGATATEAVTSFPAGLTIYGRWTSFTPSTSIAGGVIYYFGK